MTRLGVSLVAMLLVTAGAGAEALAAKAKAKAKPAKASGPAPLASDAEINKLKGDFKWGMTSDEVLAKIKERIQKNYEDRLNKAARDPSKYDRIQKEMRAELQQLEKTGKIVFDGTRTGYDSSIVDQEFGHNNSESMLVAKENTATRYFFFAYERLYKMFIAFDKNMIGGKKFEEFGAMMQSKFGKAREVHQDQTTKTGVRRKLDHYLWSARGGDALRLVDRSEFYDVFCLVVYEAGTEERQLTGRPKAEGKKDSLVEAVTANEAHSGDSNDDVVDRIIGRSIKKPGEGRAESIVVPSVAGGTGARPTEASRPEPAVEVDDPKSGKTPKVKDGRPAEAAGLQL